MHESESITRAFGGNQRLSSAIAEMCWEEEGSAGGNAVSSLWDLCKRYRWTWSITGYPLIPESQDGSMGTQES